MSIFTSRRPQGFRHTPIYYDERTDKLRRIETEAKRRLGLLPTEGGRFDGMRGRFALSTVHLRRRKERESEGRRPLSAAVLLVIIAALVILWVYLSA